MSQLMSLYGQYALFESERIVGRTARRFFLKLGDQGAAEQDERKGLRLERPPDLAGLLHEPDVRLWRR